MDLDDIRQYLAEAVGIYKPQEYDQGKAFVDDKEILALCWHCIALMAPAIDISRQ